MAIWDTLIKKNEAGFKEAFGLEDCTSAAMKLGIKEWYDLYYGKVPDKSQDSSCRLAYTIVSKLCRTVFGEYSATLAGDSPKITGLRQALDCLNRKKTNALQQAMIGGECLIKPVVTPHGFDFLVLKRTDYTILSRGAGGQATAYGTAEVVQDGKHAYTLLECRSLDANGRMRIKYKLYRAEAPGLSGKNVPLGHLPRYSNLAAEAVLPLRLDGGKVAGDVRQSSLTGLIAVKMPMVNCVDGSSDGVSIYAPAAEAIRNADALEGQIGREFGNSASRVIVSNDLLARGTDGRSRLQEDIFLAVDDDPANVGITVYAPPIRDDSFLRRKNDILRGIESIIGFKRGILAEVNEAERTATEITSSSGEYNLAICDLQNVWEQAVVETLQVCDVLGQLYYGWDDAPCPAPAIDFGDGVLFDRPRVWNEYMQMVENGMMKPEIALAWYFNQPVQNHEMLAHIKQQYMPEQPGGSHDSK